MKRSVTLMFISVLIAFLEVEAGPRFNSSYPCSDIGKYCASSGERTVDGFKVHRDCWEWVYTKSCNYPSRNDCRSYMHCYFVGNRNCLLKDSLGNCVNLQREFSCKSWDPVIKESNIVRTGLKEKDGQDTVVCQGIPCIDGNCVDKSYLTNGEMMDSLTKLYAVSKMTPDKQGNFNLFQGSGQHCSKKPTSYSNCCSADPKGWGREFGARCTKDEKDLADRRSKNLCIYVGKQASKTAGVTTVVKHQFCCWGNLLDKVVQEQGRKQLGMNFGSAGSPNCRGLSLEEIQRLDFSKLDFTEFIEDFKLKFAGKYKAPKADDLARKVKNSVDGIRKYDGDPDNPQNNMSGWSRKVEGD